MMGLIKRTCKGLNDLKTLRTLNFSLVWSNLKYCSVVWPPYSRKNLDKLDGVQRRDLFFSFFKSGFIYSVSLKITSFDHT